MLDAFGLPIGRLYAAGELGGVFGHLYISGGNLAARLESAIARLDPETDAIHRVAIDGITGGMVVDANGDVWVAVRAQTV